MTLYISGPCFQMGTLALSEWSTTCFVWTLWRATLTRCKLRHWSNINRFPSFFLSFFCFFKMTPCDLDAIVSLGLCKTVNEKCICLLCIFTHMLCTCCTWIFTDWHKKGTTCCTYSILSLRKGLQKTEKCVRERLPLNSAATWWSRCTSWMLNSEE